MADTADESAATGETRRDFLYLATAAVGAAGAAAATWPFIHSMNPAADIRALAVTEVDLSPVAVGQSITVKWQGRPVFIRRRTAAEIAAAQADDAADLPDPEPDAKRVKRPEWLIVVGICTHLGCVPIGQRAGEDRGDFGGWFCPCHGSHYDTSGRIRKGPAPRNLDLPGEVIGEDLHGYAFLDDTTVRIG